MYLKTLASLSPKKLFLIDSLGALLSSGLLGLVLTRFEAAFGIPQNVLYILSFMAFLLSAYSFFCFLYVSENWKTYMKGIAVANLIYVCLTIVFIGFFYQKITTLGVVYFVLELIVISGLAMLELKIKKANERGRNTGL